MKTLTNEALLCDLRTILGCLDEQSELADSQRAAIATFEQLQNKTYTIYSENFGNSSWQYECECLGIPHETEEVEIGFIVKSLKIDTSSVTKHFGLNTKKVHQIGDFIYADVQVVNGEKTIEIAVLKNNEIVYSLSPIFSIGETFTLPYDEYEEDGSYKTITEAYTVTGYDLSGSHAEGIVYLGDGGSAWIMENALIEQKAKFKAGETFTVSMKTLKLTRQQILDFAVKYNLEYAIKDLNYYGTVIDGGTVEDFMSKAKYLNEYVQTYWNPSSDEVVFVHKQDILGLFDQAAVNTIGLMHEIRYNKNVALDLPISVLGEYQKYFSGEHYEKMKDIQHEDYMEFFYESIVDPIIKALKGAGFEVSDWTYIATIDFVLDNIVPDKKEVDTCKNYLDAIYESSVAA